jgi:hypothetical protein
MARLAGGDGVDGQTAGIAGGELEDLGVHKIQHNSTPSEGLFGKPPDVSKTTWKPARPEAYARILRRKHDIRSGEFTGMVISFS